MSYELGQILITLLYFLLSGGLLVIGFYAGRKWEQNKTPTTPALTFEAAAALSPEELHEELYKRQQANKPKPKSRILKAPTPAEVRKAREKEIEAEFYKDQAERQEKEKGTFAW